MSKETMAPKRSRSLGFSKPPFDFLQGMLVGFASIPLLYDAPQFISDSIKRVPRRNMRDDWEAVGSDLRSGMLTYRQTYMKRKDSEDF